MNAFSKPFEHSWQRHPKHLFYEDLPFIAYTPISNFIPLLSPPPTHTHPPFRLKLPTLTALSVISFLWLNGWLRHIWCVILLKDIMVLHIPSLCTLVPEGRSCVFYATRHQVYWGLIQVSFCWYSDLFDITHTNTHKHTAYSEASRLTHPYKYIFLPSVMCSMQLSLLHWMNNSLEFKNLLSTMFFKKNYSLWKRKKGEDTERNTNSSYI